MIHSRLNALEISLAELSSQAPVSAKGAIELVGDTHKLTKADATDFVQQASQIGFVNSEGEGTDRLLFNGNLFRRDTASKTMKVLSSLSSAEQNKVSEFEARLKSSGAIVASEASALLGETLFSKARAAALYDMNIVSNEAGDHVFITAPGAFHKFSNPLTEDAFDHAKALVAALVMACHKAHMYEVASGVLTCCLANSFAAGRSVQLRRSETTIER